MAGSWSAVLASHNGERYVEEQLGSILDQSVPPDRVVVGDDASRDETVAVIERLASEHPLGDRVEIVRRDHALGVVGNFEELLARVDTEVVALSDQDDRWSTTRMERLIGRFDADPELLLLHHDAELIDESGAPLGGLFESLRIRQDALGDERHGRGFERLLRRNLVTGATTLLRRSLLGIAGPVPPGWIHDEWYAIVAAAADGIAVDERRLVSYRQHSANQIGARRLDLRGALDRVRQDGVERDRRLLRRAESLEEALDRLPGISPERRRLVHEKVAHERRRSALPVPRLSRARPVFGEWRSGGYTAFGNGMADVVRDLVQPRRG